MSFKPIFKIRVFFTKMHFLKSCLKIIWEASCFFPIRSIIQITLQFVWNILRENLCPKVTIWHLLPKMYAWFPIFATYLLHGYKTENIDFWSYRFWARKISKERLVQDFLAFNIYAYCASPSPVTSNCMCGDVTVRRRYSPRKTCWKVHQFLSEKLLWYILLLH